MNDKILIISTILIVGLVASTVFLNFIIGAFALALLATTAILAMVLAALRTSRGGPQTMDEM